MQCVSHLSDMAASSKICGVIYAGYSPVLRKPFITGAKNMPACLYSGIHPFSGTNKGSIKDHERVPLRV